LFKLLTGLKFYSEIETREKMKVVHRFVTQNTPAVVRSVRRGSAERRADILVTYLDGNAKSGHNYAAKYAEENLISTANVVSPEEALRIVREVDLAGDARYKAIVIVDDVVATGHTMSNNLDRFLKEGKHFFVHLGVVVLAVAVAATAEGEGHVRDVLHRYDNIKVDLRICDPITLTDYAFEKTNGLWETE
jgi:phosphoribosylpyrophosphate synthetase